MRIVVCGLSITSSWGNGHATTYRSLLGALARRGHEILFLERDVPWYADNRDLPDPPYARVALYRDDSELADHAGAIADADLTIVGSYVPNGTAVANYVLRTARGVRAFYDIDTPITLAKLERGDREYLCRSQVPEFDLYLSFSGGPVLQRLEREYGARRAVPLYCSVQAESLEGEAGEPRWELGYLGTYSEDRQPGLVMRLFEPARHMPHARFVVAGAQFPPETGWPANVDCYVHIPPAEHAAFYRAQRYTLNLTRRAMVEAGYSPSVRLFEAAACGVPIISDDWPGLDTFFAPGEEILVSRSAADTLAILEAFPETERRQVALRARARVREQHTADHRAAELEAYIAGQAGIAV